MAEKLPRLQRVLDARTLYSVAYGEIASSLYFALGIIALHALGLTPEVLLLVGILFLVVSLSYAEGTSAIPETGGAATFVRKAFNDFAGFLTGWALFLDYLIVIALSALYLPHYVGGALGVPALEKKPWDVVVGCGIVLGIAAVRLVKRPALHIAGIAVAVLDLVTQLLLVALGFGLLFSGDALTRGTSLGSNPSWRAILFALPLAMLAYTGLETVANLAEEARTPGVTLPRSLFGAIGTVVLVYVLLGMVGLSAFPASGGTTQLGTTWLGAPLLGIVHAMKGSIPNGLDTALRVYVGLTGALILFTAATTSISGFSRLAYSLGEHGMLPSAFGRLNRRSLVSRHAIVSVAAVSVAILVGASFLRHPIAFLASVFSFGVLLAFTAAQLAVVRLRAIRPELERPYRVPFSVRLRGVDVPLPSVVGSVATAAVFVVAMVTHEGARYAGPGWLVVGVGVYVAVRRSRGVGLLEHVVSTDEQELAEATFSRILVPMKLGLIGEEMLATAVKLAQQRGSAVEALHVILVPLSLPIDAELPEKEAAAAESLAEAKLLGEEHGVEVNGRTVRARAIGEAIVEEAARAEADLVVLGSAPRWRRQSRFFSPTVEYVLRRAPCEVLVVAFPQGVIDEESELAAT